MNNTIDDKIDRVIAMDHRYDTEPTKIVSPRVWALMEENVEKGSKPRYWVIPVNSIPVWGSRGTVLHTYVGKNLAHKGRKFLESGR